MRPVFSPPASLPIDAVLPGIVAALADAATPPRLVIAASPGAGKTTRVPLALLDAPWACGQRLILLEPRRIAARAAARHMARLLGEDVGRTVGYRTALDSRESSASRILVVTEGVLTRMIQADPELGGIACLMFDEFHERSLQADLGLALSLDCQQALRPDLRLVIMSATLDGQPMDALLGSHTRITAEGRSFPVTTRYLPPVRPGMRVDEQALVAIRETLRAESGSMLVFLPGVAEIRRVASALAGSVPAGVLVRPLYGDLPPDEQDAAVAPAAPGERKIVLATNIAESSLTIEGVRIVIDTGLTRRQQVEPAWGMSRLVTERVSRAAAEQRRGRAGRLEPGICLRLWPEHEHAALPERSRPDMLVDDLTQLCLELALWGVSDPSALHWLDPPPAQAWHEARRLLCALDALDDAGRVTARGRAMAALPLHPRLAHMVLEGKARGQGMTACALAVMLAERDPLRTTHGGGPRPGVDINPRLSLLVDAPAQAAPGPIRRVREQMRRLAQRAGIDPAAAAHEHPDCGALLALAWPERVALRRLPGKYLMANGRGAELPQDDPLAAQTCLAVAALDANNADARIHLAAPLDRAELETLFAAQIVTEPLITWDMERQAVSARLVRRMGALTLAEKPLPDPPSEQVRAVLLEAIRAQGLSALPWSPELRTWLDRVRFVGALCVQGLVSARSGDPAWPDVSDAALLATLPDWLGPYLDGVDRLSGLTPPLVTVALHALVPWELARRLDALAPEHLRVPSGSSIPLDYSNAGVSAAEATGPILAVKLQELFGLAHTPAVAEGAVPVVVHMLSPAGRPVQITKDLAGFWKQGYAAVRAELRGRYPKHPWPDDPMTAVPTRHTKKRMQA